MSLQSRLESFIAAVGADIKLLNTKVQADEVSIVGVSPLAVNYDAPSGELRVSLSGLAPAANWTPLDQGLCGWAFDPATSPSNAAPGSGSAFGATVKAAESRTLTKLWCQAATAGASLTYGAMGIYDMQGNLLGSTANDPTQFQSIGAKGLSLQAGVPVVAGTKYHIEVLQIGTTRAGLVRGYSVDPNAGNINLSGPPRFSQLNSQSALPATINMATVGASSVAYWMGMS